MTTISTVLNQAADDICMFGHHKGAAFGVGPGDDNYEPGSKDTAAACSMGAIGRAAGRLHPKADKAAENLWCATLSAFAAYLDLNVEHIPDWNDIDERTDAEVVDAMRMCALVEQDRAAREVERVVA